MGLLFQRLKVQSLFISSCKLKVFELFVNFVKWLVLFKRLDSSVQCY